MSRSSASWLSERASDSAERSTGRGVDRGGTISAALALERFGSAAQVPFRGIFKFPVE
jgi:hypothetical protein